LLSTVFFIHLQKTAGTSINHAAVEQFSRDRVLMLYGSDSRWTSASAKAIIARPHAQRRELYNALSDHIVSNDIAFFSSHLSAARLRCFDPERAFTILRNPVDRVISQYFFFRQRKHTSETIEEFIERPENRNRQSRSLLGVDLESLAAVGITERYGPFLEFLNGRLGLQFRQVHRKRGGLIKALRARMLGASLLRHIAELNEEDEGLYERALRIVSRRGD
jgi:hypothetical protein